MVADGEKATARAFPKGVEVFAAFDVEAVHDACDEARASDDSARDQRVVPALTRVPAGDCALLGFAQAFGGVGGCGV